MADAKWYVVHTYSGYENKVKVDIEKTIENRNLQEQILEVSVPMLEVAEMKNGVEKLADKKMFPGYVLIHMVMNDDTWYVVRNTRGVTGFVGPGSKPVPLSEEEMAGLGFARKDVVAEYEVGDTIVVTAGAWKDTIGAIKSINEGKKTLTINVEMFGRDTPVELNFTEVRKM
ncbi:transcription termination/antitermination factor NusG [Clostridiaceae bacterium]|nr:transcription termination/antitermination factor NusG [Lachnospiraceae bacterium]NBH71842.1 transcription termination/antitermination factor NusG [Clostridiaceae bacterium]RKI15336.1 transcription termination/antitermination factor NusG [bacterium 1XD21-70]